MLGDEFKTAEPPELRLRLIGTAPFKKVTLLKDDEEVSGIKTCRTFRFTLEPVEPDDSPD